MQTELTKAPRVSGTASPPFRFSDVSTRMNVSCLASSTSAARAEPGPQFQGQEVAKVPGEMAFRFGILRDETVHVIAVEVEPGQQGQVPTS